MDRLDQAIKLRNLAEAVGRAFDGVSVTDDYEALEAMTAFLNALPPRLGPDGKCAECGGWGIPHGCNTCGCAAMGG